METIMGVLQNTWPIILMATFFYFALYRPNKRQQKRRAEMLSNLKRGARIITGGGIYGTIVEVEKDIIVLQIAEKTEIRLAREAVREVLSGKAAKK